MQRIVYATNPCRYWRRSPHRRRTPRRSSEEDPKCAPSDGDPLLTDFSPRDTERAQVPAGTIPIVFTVEVDVPAPSAVHSGTGGDATGIAGWVVVAMALGASGMLVPVLARRNG